MGRGRYRFPSTSGGLVIVAVCGVLLRLLCGSGRARHRVARLTAAGPSGPGPGPGRQPRRWGWFASAHESRWHACSANTEVRQDGVWALCGHLARRGPFRCRAGNTPPEEEQRSACEACLHVVGYLPPRLPRLKPVYFTTDQPDPEPNWPTTDPDEGAPGSPYLPGTKHQPTGISRHRRAAGKTEDTR
ncbi:hypothetical protein [Actinopolyspora mortivallis]|uniref:hypothetical protein n=1 Tax=Actinopolyspora mortivallis TaxID=33906 RepID=UPI0015E5AD7D|nr:hypothetical protein [Actinopolyspora mortivallis]